MQGTRVTILLIEQFHSARTRLENLEPVTKSHAILGLLALEDARRPPAPLRPQHYPSAQSCPFGQGPRGTWCDHDSSCATCRCKNGLQVDHALSYSCLSNFLEQQLHNVTVALQKLAKMRTSTNNLRANTYQPAALCNPCNFHSLKHVLLKVTLTNPYPNSPCVARPSSVRESFDPALVSPGSPCLKGTKERVHVLAGKEA